MALPREFASLLLTWAFDHPDIEPLTEYQRKFIIPLLQNPSTDVHRPPAWQLHRAENAALTAAFSTPYPSSLNARQRDLVIKILREVINAKANS
jgi:hypothetical protein